MSGDVDGTTSAVSGKGYSKGGESAGKGVPTMSEGEWSVMFERADEFARDCWE